MRYQGGKSRIANQISTTIIEKIGELKCDTFISLFCGSCAVEVKLANLFNNTICNDNHKYLIALYKALQNGYNPPAYITEEEYRRVRSNIDTELPEYVGFVGFGSSFGGRWFEGYGRSKKPNGEIRWHSEETKRALERDMKYLMNVEFTCLDYKDVEIPKGSVVYADPPYFGTKSISRQKYQTSVY